MEHKRKHTEAIKQMTDVVRKHQLNPQEYRYVTKIIRQNLKLYVPKNRKALPDFLNAGEVYALLNMAKESPRDALLLEFLIFTGLRIAEASAIQISHIDFKEGVLKVVDGKGGKDRYVPLTTNLQSKLLLLIGDRSSGYLWVKKNQTPYTVRALQYIVKGWIQKLNSTKTLSTHSLRHTFACLCLARGMDLMRIRDLMGHSNVNTTQIYAKMELGTVKDEFMRLMDMRG